MFDYIPTEKFSEGRTIQYFSKEINYMTLLYIYMFSMADEREKTAYGAVYDVVV